MLNYQRKTVDGMYVHQAVQQRHHYILLTGHLTWTSRIVAGLRDPQLPRLRKLLGLQRELPLERAREGAVPGAARRER